MSHPDDELLVDVALGGDDAAPGVVQHVERCPECTATVDHFRQALSLVSRTSGDYSRPGFWQAPPPRVWDGVAAAIASDAAPSTAAEATPARATTASATPASATTAMTMPSSTVTPLVRNRSAAAATGRRVWPWAAGMAAAGLAVGLLTGRMLWTDTAPPGAAVAQVDLDTLDTRQPLGEAALVRSDSGLALRIATTRALDPGDGYLEVWLINADGKRMVSVGILDSAASSFPINQDLLDEGYVVVDVSREPFDARPEHSGDSLVRGTLPA